MQVMQHFFADMANKREVQILVITLIAVSKGEEISSFYTESKIVSAYETPSVCSAAVLHSREKIAENGGPRMGVKPSVGIGEALVIFLVVGILSMAIATAFHIVRKA